VAGEPRSPGWYPDPWGGDGERWFDGTSWSRDAVDDRPAPRPGGGRTRRGLLGLVAILGVAAAVGAWFLLAPGDDTSDDSTSSTSGSGPSTTTTTTNPSLVLLNFEEGDCATWDQTVDEAPATIVDCDEPHLIELVESRRVGDDFDHYPTDAEWEYLEATLCGPVVERHLGARVDPQGLYAAGSTFPTADSWERGERAINCGVIRRGDAASPQQLVAFTGKVDGTHQYIAKAPGTCLPLEGDGVGPAVPCDQPHALEVVGAVDLSGRIDHAPNDEERDEILGDDCERQAAAYLGHAPTGDVRTSWLTLVPGAWEGGHRILECTIGRYPDDASDPTTVTGSLRNG
jgi:hypothetical protein